MAYVVAHHPTGGSHMSFEPNTKKNPFTAPPLQRTMSSFDSISMASMAAPERADNIMNRRGGLDSSLYQSCLALKRRLAEVPGFSPYLTEMDQEERDMNDATDPVTSIWNMLRRGFPLMAVYNALQPDTPLAVNHSTVTEAKIGKAATFKFLQACLQELQFPPDECFLITDLYGQDTTGFVKVLKVINRVLDTLGARGKLLRTEDNMTNPSVQENLPKTNQQKIIDEIVTTERDYVQHLETLQQFKNQVEQTGAIPGDLVHDIFLNLNALLDFQRRFLIRIEQQNNLEPAQQNWGQLFVQYEDAFRVYEPYLANQNRCNEIVTREWEKIKSAPLSPAFQGMVETQSILMGFLVKPFQRLTRYPMLLNELRKRGDFNEDKIQDLQAGAEVSISILARANQAMDKEQRLGAVQELHSRVDDWKGHKLDHFGELFLYGNHTVLKGDGQKEVEREVRMSFSYIMEEGIYKIYLFERILLCCKELNLSKPKNRIGARNMDKKGKPRLLLKGRIFMQNVTDVLFFPKNGSYFLQIFWRGDPGVENFTIRFANEELGNKWHDTVNQTLSVKKSRSSGQTGTSDTELVSMRLQAKLPNPYYEEDGEDEDGEDEGSSTTHPSHDFSMSRNASSTSLRSRSTTGSSGPHASQLPSRPPPRFPVPDHVYGPNGPPLTISTNITPGSATPDERVGDSYFSPIVDSPASARSSSNMFPFPRQHLQSSMSNRWIPDENKHNTAPPMSRGQDQTQTNGYTMNGRAVQRPSLPVMTGSQSAQQLSLAQSRVRSASSPDIPNANSQGPKRYVNGYIQPGLNIIPVPPIPPHMRAPINRSQSGSPVESQRRTISQSQKASKVLGVPQQYAFEQSQQSSFQSAHGLESRHVPPKQNSEQAAFQLAFGAVPYNAVSAPPSITPIPAVGSRIMSPSIGSSTTSDDQSLTPSQLKVKVWFEPQPSHVTIVVGSNIRHRTLIDRIDTKMQKISSGSIAKGTARLRYHDSDGDFIVMKCDEDVSIAIEEWKIVHDENLRAGVIPDFELYWSEINP